MTAGVFDRIYRANAWNGADSRSGPGSGDAATARLVPEILRLVEELDVQSVLDVGCGDGYWMPDLPGYVGYDWSPVAVAYAKGRHPDRSYVSDRPTGHFDLVICRDVIQHLPLQDGVALVERMRDSGNYLLASTYVGGENVDIVAGDAYSPDLTGAPFGLPHPERLIFDGHYYHNHDTGQVRDPRKNLGLWRCADG